MTRTVRLAIAMVCFMAFVNANAQAPKEYFQVFDLNLKTKNGVKDWPNQSDTEAYNKALKDEAKAGLITNNQKVVDINTSLQVKIDKDLVRNFVGTTAHPELMGKITRLKKLVLIQTKMLQGLDKNDPSTYYNYAVEFYSTVSEDPELKAYVNAQIDAYYELPKLEQTGAEPYVFKQIDKELATLYQQLENSDTFKGNQVQLVAYLVASGSPKQIHVENFDNLDQGTFYNVQQFVTSFSEADQAEFASLAEVAKKANDLQRDKFNIQDIVKELPSYSCALSTYNDLQALIISQESTIASLPKEVRADWNGLRADLENIATEFKAALNSSLGSTDFLNQANGIAQNLHNKVSGLEAKASASVTALESKLSNSEKEVKDFVGDAKTCLASVKSDLSKIGKFVNGVANALSRPDFSQVALEVSEKTLSFTVNELPETGNIYLKQSGRRENGDQLIIKLMVGKEGQERSDYQVVGTPKVYELNLIGLYSETHVSLALGFPKSTAAIEHSTYFMPSGNLLFKIGSRRSKLYNNVFSLGFGPSIQAPDMDGDGAPEVAAGVVLTTLKDYVGFGWSYNFSNTANTGFWFITLSLPVNVPGLPINSVAQE